MAIVYLCDFCTEEIDSPHKCYEMLLRIRPIHKDPGFMNPSEDRMPNLIMTIHQECFQKFVDGQEDLSDTLKKAWRVAPT